MNPDLGRFNRALDEVFNVPPSEGPSRVTDLKTAVSQNIKPGMALHTLVTHAFPYGLINEVLRQFWKKDPGFTLLTLGAVNHAVMMLEGGLLERIVTTYCGDVYPAPGPNPNFNTAYLEKKVSIENWSVLSFCLRLLAGALGLAGIPSRSLMGSSMAEDNSSAYAAFSDPFEGSQQGFVKALRPDVSLVHGWVADPAGNVLFSPPLAENLWGALAAKNGAIVSVEKIVDTDFIRANSHLTRLPAQLVRAVVELPFGAHPGGFYGRPVTTCKSYAEDYDFIVDFRNANRDPDKFAAWLDQWVLGCRDHHDYLKRVGPSRLTDLIQKGRPDAWESELARLADLISDDPRPLPTETMTVEAARRIYQGCKDKGYSLILAGQGISNLAAWLASFMLKSDSLEVDLVAETGFYGYTPRPASPFLFNFANIPNCKMLTDSLLSLGGLVGSRRAGCIGSLSAGQVDKFANINSTLIPDVMYLVGSGGACDVLNTARETILTVPLAPLRYLDRVPYITGPGSRVTTVVSDKCVFVKQSDQRQLRLASLVKDGDRSAEDIVSQIKAMLGWEPKIDQELNWVEPAGPDQLLTIRMLDPRRAFLKPPK
jgi:acyl CoA:acetate/3-ketoacid CoA transferase alpha subunit/acyl CoA:acetate/3-ketoacid CoA transferase beta subunit